MKPKPRYALSNILLALMVLILGVGALVLGQRAVRRRASETSSPDVLQATQLAPMTLKGLPTEVLPPMTPKPRETRVPTPWPIATLPVMTPLPIGVSHLEKTMPDQSVERPTPSAGEPYNLTIVGDGGGNTQIALRDAQAVVMGTVKDIMPARWDTPSGQRPSNPWAPDNKYTIFRPVLVEVEQHFKGRLTTSEVLLYALGGTVGQDSVTWGADDSYTFHQGERVIVFLSANNNAFQGNSLWSIVSRYTVTADGQAINHYGSMSFQQLINTIRATEKQ